MRPHFKLRTLLIVVTLCALALGGWRWYTESYRQARIAMDELADLRAQCETEDVVFPGWARWLPWTRDCAKITRLSNYFMGPISQQYAMSTTMELRPKNRNLDDRVLKVCGRVNTLERVDLPYIKITDDGIASLAHMHSLRVLRLDSAPITDDGLARLRRLTKLQVLDLGHSRITDSGLADLQQMRELSDLTIGSPYLTDRCGQYLRECRSLEELSVGGPAITDRLFEDLQGLHLKRLRFIGTHATGEGLKSLKNQSQLTYLSMSLNYVDDRSIANLALFPNLRCLQLNEPELSDAAIEHLLKIPHLGQLYIGWCPITQTARDRLKKAMPKCFIDSNHPMEIEHARNYRERFWTRED